MNLKVSRSLKLTRKRQFETVQLEIGKFELSDLDSARSKREQAFRQYYVLDSELRTKENRKKDVLQPH